MKKEIGVYVHIPFCKRKCYYCDFVSYPNKEDYIEEYANAVLREIQNSNLEKYRIKTIYIGGGTPSILDSKLMWKILKEIKQYAITDAEITIEVNPGTVDKEKLRDYISFGINRLSIGLQSTYDEILKSIGRIHNYQDFLEVYNLARNVGFNNINVDLMLGLPNQTLNILMESLKKVIELKPEHISLYSLILEEGTKLFKLVQEGRAKLVDEEIERAMYWETKKVLESSGYIHYEISNFAKCGYESKHNMDCWKQKEYIGFGAAAHSYLNDTRYSNLTSLQDYINNIKNGDFGKNIIVHENQTKEEKRKRIYDAWFKKIRGSVH